MLNTFTLALFSYLFICSESINKAEVSELSERITCEQTCRARFQRSCSETPPMCGQCALHYTEEHGVCRDVHTDYNPESDIDKIAESRRDAAQRSQENEGYDAERSARDNSPSRKQSTTVNQPTLQMSAQQAADASTMSAGIFIAVVVGCSVAGVVGLIVAGVCWYRLQKTVKATSEVDYPAYGVTGPTKDRLGSPGDRKLAQSAQMYHYQHQKQQMIAMEKAHGDLTKDGSEADSDEENDEGDYTVFECPGLAPTGEMEVKNPLFSEDTPVTPATGDTPAPAPRGAPHK